ncbi:hypothetical protein BsWGS_19812 [Bradybaena similaris]
MAEVVHSETGSPDTDKDFDLTVDMMVHDYDDERTLDEEEAMAGSDTGELDDLQKESEMPIEDLLAQYTTGAGAVELTGDLSSDTSSSSEDEGSERQELAASKAATHYKHNNGSIASEPTKIVSRSQTERLLRSTSHRESDDSESSSEDESYEPIEERKKTIQVGSDFQAVIPVGLSIYGDAPAYENEDRLLWDPSKIKDENALNEYLCNIQREVDKKVHTVSNIPRGKHIRDDEQALFLLLQCDNNIEEAERRRKMQAVPPTDVMSLWSEDECRNFEDGLRLYGKNFHEIHHNKVRTRSVYELVHFYYLWKKTERHDIFAAKTRAEKRKYALNPGAIDHMDRFLEEQVVELNQLMSPQTSEAKIETNEDEHAKSNIGIFSTGKTTILSPSRHADKTFGPSKRYHPHHHEINGSSGAGLAEYSSSKKLKTDNSASDHHTPKKQKLHENLQESSRTVEMNSSASLPTSIPFTAMPAKCPGKGDHSSEQGSQPKHIGGNAAASVAAGGLSNQDSDSSSARQGQSASVDISLTREISETSGSLSGKFGSVISSVSGKSLGEGGDKHTSCVANCI